MVRPFPLWHTLSLNELLPRFVHGNYERVRVDSRRAQMASTMETSILRLFVVFLWLLASLDESLVLPLDASIELGLCTFGSPSLH